jgi:hypothetical protein
MLSGGELGGAPYESRRMKLRGFFYKSDRTLGDVEAVTSGDPGQIDRRAKNKILGRALGRSGFWRTLWR